MTMLSAAPAPTFEKSAAAGEAESARAARSALSFAAALQAMILEEVSFVGQELLDRAVTETHLFNEFLSKVAEAHSVKDLKTMWEECGRHQIDFIRRDCERLLRHDERMAETASRLFGRDPQA
ncbi:MAG TPA: hypothetical protein VKR55_03345 [Bradyrhizobium sp.]|uniref:hypothetical protein n=1 Tax=Bradyrhizobium sp. TaxID=376 RepID=UPI002BFCEC64|nr:hypothetical protein [Bradyrhizobium sp.]HLZ01168.1 hypothetical protein [Bradyrhizobium sp.]